MARRFGATILVVSFLAQLCDHFLIQPSNALRMINLDAPQMALEGDTIQLSCTYSLVTPPPQAPTLDDKLSSNNTDRPSLELETVYAVKWYRDEIEFFRYLTRDWPHKQSFFVDGLDIDVEKSDNRTVVLRSVSLKTSGLFRCEVSIDAPSFLAESIERRLLIHHLPNEGPIVEHLNSIPGRQQYVGAQLNFLCRSKESKPASQIDWIINDTLNLTAAENLPVDSSGKPVAKLLTHRMVRLPLAQPGDRPPRSISHFSSHLREGSSSKFVYLVESQLAVQQTPLGRGSVASYTLEDPDAVAKGHRDRNSISLPADSLDQLLESSISWLNLTADANLLHYLSGAGASPDKLAPLDVTWTTRKASLNQTSRGNASVRTRGKIVTNSGSGQRNAPPAKQHSRRLSLRVRCVARVMHLSLSGDVCLHLINKTRQVDTEAAHSSAGPENARQQNSSGSRHFAGSLMHAICLSISVTIIWITLEINAHS